MSGVGTVLQAKLKSFPLTSEEEKYFSSVGNVEKHAVGYLT